MVSTTLQVSLLLSEANLLEAEANRQLVIILRERSAMIARGEKAPKLTTIGAATVAAQIIRAALHEVEKRSKGDKRKRG